MSVLERKRKAELASELVARGVITPSSDMVWCKFCRAHVETYQMTAAEARSLGGKRFDTGAYIIGKRAIQAAAPLCANCDSAL